MPKKTKEEKEAEKLAKAEAKAKDKAEKKAEKEAEKREEGSLDEISEAKAKETEEDEERGPILAKCEVCDFEVEVPHLRKSGCPKCGCSGLRAK